MIDGLKKTIIRLLGGYTELPPGYRHTVPITDKHWTEPHAYTTGFDKSIPLASQGAGIDFGAEDDAAIDQYFKDLDAGRIVIATSFSDWAQRYKPEWILEYKKVLSKHSKRLIAAGRKERKKNATKKTRNRQN